ncbi:unnamed protein product [Lampetra fluviatilis]
MAVRDLQQCCQRLDVEKVTERKKEAERFSRLIVLPDVIAELDRCSDLRPPRGLTWDAVFKFVQRYMQRETDALQTAASTASTSTTARSNRQARSREVVTLCKRFVRIANRRGTRLKCSELVRHVLETLSNKCARMQFGSEYIMLLIRDVLSVRRYWCEITASTWADLQKLCCRLLESKEELDRAVLALAVRLLLSACSFQCDTPYQDLPCFSLRALHALRHERSPDVLERTATAVTAFLRAAGANDGRRRLLCRVGEESGAALLYVWLNTRPCSSAKRVLWEFFLLQMSAHHPRGARHAHHGALAGDIAAWHRVLAQLYDAVCSELKEMGGRIRFSGPGRPARSAPSLPPAFADLAAHVCHQLFNSETNVLEMIEAGGGDSGGNGVATSGDRGHANSGVASGGSDGTLSGASRRRGSSWDTRDVASKRRRVDLGWEALRETLLKSQVDGEVLPWLEIMNRLLDRHPDSLPRSELVATVTTLNRLQASRRRQGDDRTRLSLLCLNQFAKIQPVDVGVEERRVWRTSWSLALRSLPSAPACETRALALLSTLLQRGLVPPEPDAWRALLTCRPSRSAVELLLRLVSRQMVPAEGGTAAVAALAASWQPGLVSDGSESTSQESAEEAAWTEGDRRDPTLRRSLMAWLLARQSSPSEDGTEKIEPPAVLQGDFPPFLVSRALVCLTLKDNRAAARTIFSDTDFRHSSPFESSLLSNEDNTYYPRDEGLAQMEELFLLSTFEVSDPEPTLPGHAIATHLSTASIHTGVMAGSKVMTPVRFILEEKVVAFAESLIGGQDVQPVPPECLARGAALLCGLVAGFRLVGADADDAGRKSVLLEKAKLLMRSVGEFVSTNVSKATESHVACAIKALVASCTSAVGALDSTQVRLASSLFLLTIPACFITDLLGLVKHMDKQVGSTDLFSDDMDTSTTATTSNSSDLEMLGDNLGRGGESCEDVPLCVLSDEQLSRADQLALDTTAFLCACAHGASVAARVSGTAPQFNPSQLRCGLLTLCSPAQLDLKRAVHVRMYLCLLEKFPSTGGDPFGMDYSSLLTSLRTICSHYRSDQEVCAALLCRLPPLIRALGCTSGSDRDLTDARQKLRAALSGFWLLRGKGQCTAAVRAALLTCMATMLEVDAQCRWAILEVESTALPVREAFPEFLGDRQHRVRMLAAQALHRLFLQRAGDGLSAEWQPLPPAVQQDSFERVREKVFTCLRTAVKEQGTDQPEDKCVDSEPNGASVLLAALGTVARCSSLCEKQALYAMVQAQLRHGVAITVIAKAVRVVSLALNQASPTRYLESHLGYLLHHWLSDRKTLENFPFQLLECDTVEEFYRRHWLEVVPRLAMRQDFNGVRAASAAMGVDWRDALVRAFPRLFTRVLPLFVEEGEEGKGHPAMAARHERTEAVLVYEFLCRNDCLGKKRIDELVQANLPEVVTELLGTLHEPSTCGEPSDVGRYASELDPAPNPPTFSAYVIRASMEYLGKCHGGVGKSLIGHLARTPDSIQKILLAVGQQVQLATDAHERHRVLMMYRLFIGHLLGELQDGLGGSGAFVLRDVIYTLVHLINSRPNVQDETSGRSFSLCLDLLNVSCRAGVTWRPEALAPHLHAIVAALLPLITWTSPPQQSSSTSSSTSSQKKHGYASDIAKQALALLDFLVINCQAVEPLSRALSRLDPFPHQQTLEHLRSAQERVKYQHGKLSLLQELEHFLSAGVWQGLAGARVDGVRHLHVQLAQRKEELCGLLAAQQDALEGGVLIRLVGGLVRMSRTALASPTGAEDTLEAVAACLGELGPVAFSTTALERDTEGQPWGLSTSITPQDPGSITTQWTDMAVALLNDALTDSSVEVRAASSTCLKAVLATRAGAEFWEHQAALPETEFFLQILAPFRNPKKKASACLELPPLPLDGRPSKELESDTLWEPDGGSHDLWLKGLTCALIRGGAARCDVLRLLGPICEAKAEVCERVLPLLLHDALLGDAEVGGGWMPLISSHLMRVLQPPRRSSAQGSSRPTTPMLAAGDASGVHVDPVSVRSVLRAIGYLRRHQRPNSQTPWDNNFWLSLNHLQVASAAQACGAHFTALLYAEIYASTHRPQDGSGDFSGRSSHDEDNHKSLLENISETGMDEANISLQDLLLEVYRSIGEPDSLYGCRRGHPVHALARVRTYEHEGEWEKALGVYDLDTALPMGVRQAGILQALQNCGLDLVLQRYLRGLEEESPECSADLEEMRYQAAWRAGQWDRQPSSRSEPRSLGYHECLYYSLQALHDREFSSFTQHLAAARVQEMRELSALNLESVHAVYPALCRLRSLSEMEAAGQRLAGPDVDALAPLQDSWRQQLLVLRETDFRYQEPVLSLRTALHRQAAPESTGALVDHLTELARLARLAGNTRVSERAIQSIRQCPRRPHGVHAWQVEDAEMFWAKQEQGRAMGIMKGLLGTLKAQVAGECAKELLALYAECLGRYGHWLAETCSESPSIILSEYLEKAVSVAERAWGDGSGGSDMGESEGGRVCRAALYLSLARFADAQHRSIVAYMRSAEYENKRALLRKAKEDVTLLQSLKLQPSRYMVKLQRECDLDERELLSLRQDRERFLVEALVNYVRCLRSGGAHGEARAFRLVSLWLENSAEQQVNDVMRTGVTDIPPHKFLPLIYQLAARMGTKMAGGEAFHSILQKLILRVTLTHPHHALLVVLALANAGKDELLQTVAARDGARGGSRLSRGDGRGSSAPSDDDRVRATRDLVEQVRKQQPELVRDTEKLCDAYIVLANMNAEASRKQTKDLLIPKDQPIKDIRNLYKVVIPTLELKVDPTGQYPDLVTVRAFRPHFRLAGGVNLPKIIDCEGSDGRTYRQLVKGRDDLRQDAVMQQVFHMCNELLAGSAETRTRKLSIRTYKVVPLSQRSGVLEWCVGTVPIGDYLVHKDTGAHTKYRPNDWPSMHCRKFMNDRRNGDLFLAYQELCHHFRPVFRHFFWERFLDPAVWFERRLSYTRSVATSSIVGYIVGLGDRHVQNILIDLNSAELVHIDLGVAFEQGRVLPTPETVPFRLTRDIVDGMGVTGVEGVFRRCCEKTMEVMRNSQEALLTIVEVLLFDPLFDWTMNPLKALTLQTRAEDETEGTSTMGPTLGRAPASGRAVHQERNGMDPQSLNKMAERVLMRLQQKLKGVEEGSVLSVPGQVNLLIQQATDPNNLSRLFPGWQPWV